MHPAKSQCYSPVENIKILALKIAQFVFGTVDSGWLNAVVSFSFLTNTFYTLFCLVADKWA